MSSPAMNALRTVFEVIVTAAALKAALNTLSRPMGGKPATATHVATRNRRLGPVAIEGYDKDDLEGLDYEDLL